jgi:transketolase
MGEQQLDQVTSDKLVYVPTSEFQRVCEANLPATEKATVFAALARINALYMIARAWSGHIGTTFSSLEIMSWLFLNEIRNLEAGPGACDIFFSSKGHDAPGLYAVLIGLGLLPEEQIDQLRRLGGLPGHPHVETPFIQANTGSLGMGISKAKGMALANRLNGGAQKRIFVLTGDGELQEGQFWESLLSAANMGLGEIVTIIDHNKIQSDTWVSRVGDLGDIEAKLAAFGWHVSRCDGHDTTALEQTFRELDAVTDRPKVVVADTIKGRGVSFMEGSALEEGQLYAYHSGAPTEEAYARGSKELLDSAASVFTRAGLGALRTLQGRRPPRREPRKTHNLIKSYAESLLGLSERHKEIIVLDSDLVKDCGLVPFVGRFPERFVECGIAEQDMVSMAGGMARRGILPIAHSFACFLSSRPNEQMYNQCSEGSKVIYVGSLAGLLPGGPGHSHQAVRDISSLAAIPNLAIVEPAVEAEVGHLLNHLISKTVGSAYLRLVSVKWPMPFDYPVGQSVREGQGWIVRDGDDGVVFGYGPWMLANAYEAAERVQRSSGFALRIVNLPWLNRVDRKWLRGVIGSRRGIVTLDNHYVHGGQGEMLAAAVAELGLELTPRVTRLGVGELPECGTNDEVLEHHGLDINALSRAFERTCVAARDAGIVS